MKPLVEESARTFSVADALARRAPYDWSRIDPRNGPGYIRVVGDQPPRPREVVTNMKPGFDYRRNGGGLMVALVPELLAFADEVWRIDRPADPVPLLPISGTGWFKARSVRLIERLEPWQTLGRNGTAILDLIRALQSVNPAESWASGNESLELTATELRSSLPSRRLLSNGDPALALLMAAWRRVSATLITRALEVDPAAVVWEKSMGNGEEGYLAREPWLRIRELAYRETARLILKGA